MDELLTLLFMLLAVATFICYFAVDNRVVALCIGGFAIGIRLAQYATRFFAK